MATFSKGAKWTGEVRIGAETWDDDQKYKFTLVKTATNEVVKTSINKSKLGWDVFKQGEGQTMTVELQDGTVTNDEGTFPYTSIIGWVPYAGYQPSVTSAPQPATNANGTQAPQQASGGIHLPLAPMTVGGSFEDQRIGVFAAVCAALDPTSITDVDTVVELVKAYHHALLEAPKMAEVAKMVEESLGAEPIEDDDIPF